MYIILFYNCFNFWGIIVQLVWMLHIFMHYLSAVKTYVAVLNLVTLICCVNYSQTYIYSLVSQGTIFVSKSCYFPFAQPQVQSLSGHIKSKSSYVTENEVRVRGRSLQRKQTTECVHSSITLSPVYLSSCICLNTLKTLMGKINI